MIEMLRIYSKGFLENVTIEELETTKGTSYIAPVKRENEKNHLL